MKLRFAAIGFAALSLFGSPAHAAEDFDTARIETITGLKGTWNAAERVFKVTRPRNDVPIRVDAWMMPPFMGLTSWAAFMPGGQAEAMVMGDLVLFEDELQPVLKALRAEGINIVAIHHHMTHETPRILFLHYWGRGAAESLVRSLKKTLDIQSQATPPSP